MSDKRKIELLEKSVEKLSVQQEFLVKQLKNLISIVSLMHEMILCPSCSRPMSRKNATFPVSKEHWECEHCGDTVIRT